MATKKDSPEYVDEQRAANAHPGFFLRAANWMLARFPGTRNAYQNWTTGRRILVGWVLWLVLLPIIPLAAIIIWYVHDPEGFKKSPWAKALIALFFVWAGTFGVIATSQPQLDANGKYSPIQTTADGEKSGSIVEKPESAATPEAKEKVAKQQTSKSSGGRTFSNCTAAFESGVFDIKRSDPAYQTKLDRDDDGIACER
jgi:hypothetical protein